MHEQLWAIGCVGDSEIMISIVIPAYNEEGAIGPTLMKLREALQTASLDAEILVVNDGSQDKTAEEAAAHGAKVINNPHNAGYGRSLKRGITAAKNETIFIMDADLTYPAEMIPVLLKEYQTKGLDMVVGQRSGNHYRESLIKSPLRSVLKFLVEYTTGRKVPDINSGLRVFNKNVAMNYENRLCDTFSYTTSLTLAYMMTGRFVGYVPIPYNERHGETKVRLFRDSIRTLQYILEAVVYYNPIKMFTLLAAVLLFLSMLSFLAALITHIHVAYYFGIGGVLVALLVFCQGFLALLLKQILQK